MQISLTSQSKAPLRDGSSAGQTGSITTYWYPPKGLVIVEPFARLIASAPVGGHSPCARASALSKGAPDTGEASARIVTSVELYRVALVKSWIAEGEDEFM